MSRRRPPTEPREFFKRPLVCLNLPRNFPEAAAGIWKSRATSVVPHSRRGQADRFLPSHPNFIIFLKDLLVAKDLGINWPTPSALMNCRAPYTSTAALRMAFLRALVTLIAASSAVCFALPEHINQKGYLQGAGFTNYRHPQGQCDSLPPARVWSQSSEVPEGGSIGPVIPAPKISIIARTFHGKSQVEYPFFQEVLHHYQHSSSPHQNLHSFICPFPGRQDCGGLDLLIRKPWCTGRD